MVKMTPELGIRAENHWGWGITLHGLDIIPRNPRKWPSKLYASSRAAGSLFLPKGSFYIPRSRQTMEGVEQKRGPEGRRDLASPLGTLGCLIHLGLLLYYGEGPLEWIWRHLFDVIYLEVSNHFINY